MNKRIEVEVETDPLSSYVYVERSFIVFLWMSSTLSTPTFYQANCVHYYCLQQNEMLAIRIVVLECLAPTVAGPSRRRR